MSSADVPSGGHEDDRREDDRHEGGVEPVGDWDEVQLDEAFVRSAPVVEPSGRARMLAARWRREPPQPEPWRSDRPPAGWFWSRVRKGRWRRG